MALADITVALAQVDPTVGDVDGNASLVAGTVTVAQASQVDLVVFPELVIPGYPPRDLLLKPAFIERCGRSLENIAKTTKGITAIVGTVRQEGNALFNTAAVCTDGKVVAYCDKTHLPNYDVFDEKRYFTPTSRWGLVDISGQTMLVTVCEDIWVDDAARDEVARNAELVVNISASPFYAGKGAEREGVVRRFVEKISCPVVYVNLVGGQDDLVFDGGSLVMDRDGRIMAQAPRFTDELLVVESGRGAVAAPVGRDEEVTEALCLGLRDYARKNRFERCVVGLSGGIDSAVVAALAARALGPDAVLGVTMPSAVSSKGSVDHSRHLAANLGIEFQKVPIASMVDNYMDALESFFEGTGSGVAEENVQARVRGNILMALSNKFGHLVLATGNKSEMAVGYATLYGDMAGGLALISDVPKIQVYALARFINEEAGRELIPQAIIDKPPSAELRPDQRDDDDLPPYDVLDPILAAYVEDHLPMDAIVAKGFPEAVVCDVVRRVDANEYKRYQAPLGIKVTTRAFGSGRRMPITNRFRE
ncbi:MAG: NAD+ synthase [Candidatus Undinarchaeales archaeon]|jgi:NAD+ synthase (glutamine-hydrolysing)|nr:NAD+ synthase [Candidatus Undinarchaeales archaeon]MDP7492034.1 NAD+ synthase [Candidatus Undinarchaeales archaeon]